MLKAQKKSSKFYAKPVVGSAMYLLMGISAPSVIAQEINNAINQPSNDIETIQVSGVRSSLETSLNTKREATSIVDAISSEDIDSLPALDLGEALQAIPGVQLERSGEGRQSEISLRGLSGGFVKTSAFGQSFATPSRSASAAGASNPFSAFEAGIFDGLTVIKTPTADMQAGGVAGTVDQRLQQALSKRDGRYSVSIGGRYEELTGNWDPSVKLSASKHIIKDKLAVAFKLAGSGQTFRRDTANFTTYAPLSADNSPNLELYKTTHNLPADAQIRSVASARNVTEYSDGDRVSFSGNIEWKPIDNLKLGAHLLYTKRDLDSGTKQDASFESGYNQNKPQNSGIHYQIIPDINSKPFLYDKTDGGTPIYGVTKAQITDGTYTFTNRETNFLEESKGIFLYGDYKLDNWELDSVITHSESENQFNQLGLDFRLQGHHKETTKVNGVTVPTLPTDVDINLDAAYGDLGNASVRATGWENINYDVDWQRTDSFSAVSVTSVAPSNNGRRLGHYVNGRVDNPKRDFSSAEFNAKRYTEFGFGDALVFEAIKFGARHSTENLDNRDENVQIAGLNVGNIDNDTVRNDILISDQQTSFFNGNYPGAFDKNSGWQTIHNQNHLAALKEDMSDLTDIGGVIVEPFGLYQRQVGGVSQRLGTNFTADAKINSVYAMTDIIGEFAGIYYSGNIGARYIKTDNEFYGNNKVIEDGATISVPTSSKNDYSHLLPSTNFSFDLTDDVVLRLAYNEGIVRPNLRAQTPSTDVNSGNTNVTINKASSFVEPYDAKNYDLSLAWYNREGSAMSVGVFHKEITGFFIREDSCPEGDQVVIDAIGSDLTRVDNPDTGGFTCTQNELHENDEGDLVTRTAKVTELFNSDESIRLTGVELAIQQKLDFLPYPWDGFGGVFNYTYIEQNGDEQLYGVAPESYNIIGYWENNGVSLRLAYNWKDDSVLRGTTSFLGQLDRTQKATGRLDLSASYSVSPNLKVTLRGFNLTDEQRYEHWGFDERAVSRVDYTGQIYQASVTYNF